MEIWKESKIAYAKGSGRRMEVYRPEGAEYWRCRPAPGDPERSQWLGQEKAVQWPREWLSFPGDQLKMF